jgi:hypothetical protein
MENRPTGLGCVTSNDLNGDLDRDLAGAGLDR